MQFQMSDGYIYINNLNFHNYNHEQSTSLMIAVRKETNHGLTSSMATVIVATADMNPKSPYCYI